MKNKTDYGFIGVMVILYTLLFLGFLTFFIMLAKIDESNNRKTEELLEIGTQLQRNIEVEE